MAGTDAAVLQARAADAELEAVAARLRPRFRRRAAHRHAGAYPRGLLGEVERKNGWQLAEHAGYRHPWTIQRVLDRSAWDDRAVRDDLRPFVLERFADPDLEARDHAYVLAVKSNEKPITWPPYAPPGQLAVSGVAAASDGIGSAAARSAMIIARGSARSTPSPSRRSTPIPDRSVYPLSWTSSTRPRISR